MEGDLDVAKHGTQIATVGAGEFTGEVNFWKHGLVSCLLSAVTDLYHEH